MAIIKEFKAATGIDIPYSVVDRREGDIEQVWADPSKANKILNWTANTPLKDILKSAWEWEKQY